MAKATRALLFLVFICSLCIHTLAQETEADDPSSVIGGTEGTAQIIEDVGTSDEISENGGQSSDFYCSSAMECLEFQICDTEQNRCIDCSGQVGGLKFQDACGECDGNGASCSDCNGEAYGEATMDECSVCSGGTTGNMPNSDKDDCAVCFGDNADKDDCGICFGDDADKDCNGMCFGSARADACGVCEGDSSICCGTGPDQLCNENGACDSRIHGCVCDFGWTGARCSVKQLYCTDATGTIDIVECGNNGQCSEGEQGKCICDAGFEGPGCAYKSCSGNGIYSPMMEECMCAAGFGGDLCNRCETPGESRYKQEMHMFQTFFQSLLEQIGGDKVTPSSSLAVSLGVDKLKKDIAFSGAMAYICVPPRMFSQKHVDEMVAMVVQSTRSNTVVDHKYMVDYMLIPVPKELVRVYLAGKNNLVRDADGLPVLPNSTSAGVFYDCGCKAWDAQIIEIMEEDTYEESRWTGSPAPNALHGRSKFTRSLPAPMLREKQQRAVVTLGESVNLLDQCLDVLSSMVSAETATSDEIGQAIRDGEERQEFGITFLIGLLIGTNAMTVLGCGLAFLGIYSIALITTTLKESRA